MPPQTPDTTPSGTTVSNTPPPPLPQPVPAGPPMPEPTPVPMPTPEPTPAPSPNPGGWGPEPTPAHADTAALAYLLHETRLNSWGDHSDHTTEDWLLAQAVLEAGYHKA